MTSIVNVVCVDSSKGPPMHSKGNRVACLAGFYMRGDKCWSPDFNGDYIYPHTQDTNHKIKEDQFLPYLNILKGSRVLSLFAPPHKDLAYDNLFYELQRDRGLAENSILFSPYRYMWENNHCVTSAIYLHDKLGVPPDESLALASSFRIVGDNLRRVDWPSEGHSFAVAPCPPIVYDAPTLINELISVIEGDLTPRSIFSDLRHLQRKPLRSSIKFKKEDYNVN